MKFSVKALALASGILGGLAMLGMGLENLIWSGYAGEFLQTMASVYPASHASAALRKSLLVLYGAVDGFIGGAVFAWLYNQFAELRPSSSMN